MADVLTATHDIAGISADFSTISTSTAKVLYAKQAGVSSAYTTSIDSIYPLTTDYDTVNLRMGAPAGIALRVRNPSDSMNLLFYMPTTRYKNIKLNYASQSSSVSKGQLRQVFAYSTDSGATWKTSGLSMPSDSAWLIYHRTTVTFSDTTVNNNPKFVFKITFSGNDTGTKGNNRFDNITLEGDTATSGGGSAVREILAASAGFTISPNPVENILNVSCANSTAKYVTITDMSGKKVQEATYNQPNFTIDIASLSSGLYFINVTNEDSRQTETLKFIKQ